MCWGERDGNASPQVCNNEIGGGCLAGFLNFDTSQKIDFGATGLYDRVTYSMGYTHYI